MCKKHTFPDCATLHLGYGSTLYPWWGCVVNAGNAGEQTLKQRFLEAVRSGRLGRQKAHGVEVTVKEFQAFFADINDNYTGSFLSAAAIDAGRSQMTNTQYVVRLRKGVYLVHSDVFKS